MCSFGSIRGGLVDVFSAHFTFYTEKDAASGVCALCSVCGLGGGECIRGGLVGVFGGHCASKCLQSGAHCSVYILCLWLWILLHTAVCGFVSEVGWFPPTQEEEKAALALGKTQTSHILLHTSTIYIAKSIYMYIHINYIYSIKHIWSPYNGHPH